MAAKVQAGEWIGGLSDAWSQAMQSWEQLAKGSADFDPFAGKMAAPTQAFATLLGSFGQDGAEAWSASEITRRWRELCAGNGLADPFAGLQAKGAMASAEGWFAPLQQMFGRELRAGLELPAFGPAREQQERWQTLLKAQIEAQQAQAEYQRLLAEVMTQAFARFEGKLGEHEAPGRQLTSVRAIYDLWIDAAEEAYAEAALSDEFAHAYGEMVNSQSRLRLATAVEIEAFCQAVGLPTRSEVTASHRKIHTLEREVRALKAQLAAVIRPAATVAPPAAAARKPTTPAAKKPTREPARSTAVRKASKPAARKTAKPAKAAARKTGKPAARRRAGA